MDLKCLGCGAVNSVVLYDDLGRVCLRCKGKHFTPFEGVVRDGASVRQHGKAMLSYVDEWNARMDRFIKINPMSIHSVTIERFFEQRVCFRVLWRKDMSFDSYLHLSHGDIEPWI